MKQFKRGDAIVFIASLSLAAIAFFIVSLSSKSAKKVVIKQNNETVYAGSLKDDNTIDLGCNTAVVKGGKVYMHSADCKNQVCVKTGSISKGGEIIVCAPNKIIIEIE